MTFPVAILAGGRATRLGTTAQAVPKVLIDVAGKPFAEHQIALLRSHGFDDLVFCLGHLGTMVEEVLGDGRRLGVQIRYVRDGAAPLGTGGALLHALGDLGDAFFVLYGDSYLDCDYRAIADAFGSSGCSGLMTVVRNDNRWDRSNVEFEGGHILQYDKQDRRPSMRHIDYGLGAFRRSAFDGRRAGEAFDLVEVYQALIAQGDLAGYEVASRFYEIGSPSGLEETRALLGAKSKVLQ